MLEKSMDSIWICSFDIGYKNFSFCIEQYEKSHIQHVKSIACISQKYNKNGTCTDEFHNVLNTLFKSGKVILFKNADISSSNKTGNKLDLDVFYNMYSYLNTYIEYWKLCDYIVVEEQMSFGKIQNKKACKLGQHCQSYFIFQFPNKDKHIEEFSAYHKTQILGAPKIETKTKKGLVRYKCMSKPERKKWAIQQAKYILELRNDIEHLEMFETKPKRKGVHKVKLDDISDCMLHNAAYIYLTCIDNPNPNI